MGVGTGGGGKVRQGSTARWAFHATPPPASRSRPPTVGRLVALSHEVVRATVAAVVASVAMVAVGCILRLQVGHRASSGSALPAPPHWSPC